MTEGRGSLRWQTKGSGERPLLCNGYLTTASNQVYDIWPFTFVCIVEWGRGGRGSTPADLQDRCMGPGGGNPSRTGGTPWNPTNTPGRQQATARWRLCLEGVLLCVSKICLKQVRPGEFEFTEALNTCYSSIHAPQSSSSKQFSAYLNWMVPIS